MKCLAPNGLAFSEFRGYENWQVIAVSQTGDLIVAILGNPEIIAAYQSFLDKVRGRDDVSFALVVGLLGAETHRRADVKAALAGQ